MKNSEVILKSYIKAGDHNDILSLIVDVWADYKAAETAQSLIYLSGSSRDGWDDLGKLINRFCMEPTDAMILNFAKTIEASAIVTSDIGFAVASNEIDVYMPRYIAVQCRGNYDPLIDV